MADHAPKIRVELSDPSNEIPKDVEMPDLGEEVAQQGYVKISIHHFSALRDIKRHYLEPFELCGRQWRFLIFPLGNQSDCVSLYVDYVGPKESKWACCAQFGVSVYGESEAHFREAHHRFTEEECDWGFTQFIPKKQFYAEEKGKRFVIDDTVTIGISMKIMKDPIGTLWHNFLNYDSRAETGHNGLKNQGATCYMNSILQSLFFTNYLRRAVFRMPTDEDDPAKSIPLALQRVFYHLQYSDKPVGTTELTKSFGWDTIDSFMQHDVQEFNRVLCDKLETKMKGTPVEGTINYLLEGKMKSYVRCTNVNYESAREESFYDIQLNVKGLKNLKQSFDDYIQVETLDGDNKYFAEGHGLQEAKKGVIFKKFPPVLHLQLKRFEYDMHKDAMVKINDRHEFPETIDLNDYLEESERKDPQVYHLHGVLVHSGDLHGGHYCAFLRPEKDGQWYKFDDDRVIKVHAREAMDENFGIDPEAESDKPKEAFVRPVSRFSKKFTNAYMLVYIRESDMAKVLCPVGESDISEHTRARFVLEVQADEQRRKEKEEQHLYMNVRLVTSSIAKHHHVTDLCSFETKTETPASALNLRVKKELLYKDFKQLVAEKIGVPAAKQRHWAMAKRQNGTIRPDELVDRWDAEQVGMIRDRLKLTVELKIFVEESTVEGDAGPFFEPFNPDSDVLLFVKVYDPRRALLEFEAPYQMKLSDRPVDLIAKINARNGRPAGHPLKLYEEVRPTMVEKIKAKETFQRLEIGTGDIVCYCDDLSADELKHTDLPTPPAYYEHVLNSVSVTFRDRNAPKDLTKQFTLLLSKKMTYDQVAAQVATHLGADPLFLRFVSHNHYTEGPKLEFRYEPEKLLEEMLQPNTYQPMSDILYYEKLDISIKELENKRLITVAWVSAKLTEEGTHRLLCNKTDNVEQLLELMKAKVKAAAAAAVAAPTPAASPTPTPTSTSTPAPTPAAEPAAHKEAEAEAEGKEKEKEKENAASPNAAGTPEAVSSPAAAPAVAPSATAEPEPAGSGLLRLVEVFNNRISKVFAYDEPVRVVNEYSPLYAEEIPADQLQLGEGDQLVSCFRYHKDPYASHGIPFLFVVRPNETWDKTSQRLRQRMHVTEKEFEKYKFSFVSFGRNKPITDPNAMLSEVKFTTNDCLGIDQPDRTPRTGGRAERAIVFKN